MDEIREAFATLTHHSEAGEFCVTLNCGIAAQAQHADAVAINRAADQVLYEVKRSGRDRVMLAGESSKNN